MIIEKQKVTESVVTVLKRVGEEPPPETRPDQAILDEIDLTGKVVVILKKKDGTKEVHVSKNIITDAGDLYYAERSVKTAVPSNFTDGSGDFDGIMELYNGASSTPAKANNRSNLVDLVSGSAKAMDVNYPKINDDDIDNTGADVDTATYRVSYATNEANASGIADVIITNPSPGSVEPLLMHAEFSPAFTKTNQDTLKVFVNHNFNGS